MRPNKITSLTNSRVKDVVRLRTRKQRKESGLTIIEGKRELSRAIESDVDLQEIYVCPELFDDALLNKKIAALNMPIYETTKDVFVKLSYGDRVEGILAVCAPRVLSFKDFTKKSKPIYVVVECVEKPGNLGAILRTCDGAGVDGLIVCDGRTDIYNPNVIRASLGTVFSMNVIVSTNDEALEFLRSRNVSVCATLPEASVVYTKEKLTNALAVVLGSEQNGLTEFWVKNADMKVKIPMRGHADSLNVSASTAVLLYEIIRQRS